MHVMVNTTNIKKLESEKATNKCLQIMFSSVSHELRTPMNAFSNALVLLESNFKHLHKDILKQKVPEITTLRKYKKVAEANEKYFKIGKVSTTVLMSLVEDILDLAKIEAGTFSLKIDKFNIHQLVEDVEYIFGFQCQQKGIQFKFDLHRSLLNSTFHSDIGRIKQILLNLVSNSYKFTEKGSIRIKITKIKAFDEHTMSYRTELQFEVIDTGIGISKKDAKGLFKMFGTVKKNHSKYNSKGTGLGLTICKKLAESLGGTIKLESELGKGTHITFTIKEQNNYDNR